MLKAPRSPESASTMVDRVRALVPSKAISGIRNTALAAIAALGLTNASCSTEADYQAYLAYCAENPGNCDADGDDHIGDEDCDDANAGTYPGAPEEACDGVDQNCDGEDLRDADGDGFSGCEDGSDCDDENVAIHPGASEVSCNRVDEDCDGGDSAAGSLYGLDGDGDLFATTLFEETCDEPAPLGLPDGTSIAWVNCGGDTDDNNNQIHPPEDTCPQE